MTCFIPNSHFFCVCFLLMRKKEELHYIVVTEAFCALLYVAASRCRLSSEYGGPEGQDAVKHINVQKSVYVLALLPIILDLDM